MNRTTTPATDNDFTDEFEDLRPDIAAINADPVRRARYESLSHEADLVLALAALREAVGMTQEDFASAANMSQENVSRIERSLDVKMSTIRKLAKASGARLELTAVLANGERIELLRSGRKPPAPAPASRPRPSTYGGGAGAWGVMGDSMGSPAKRRGR